MVAAMASANPGADRPVRRMTDTSADPSIAEKPSPAYAA